VDKILMDEQSLIVGCKRGESWARKKIYEQYAPVMMGVCMRYVGNKDTAEDLLQDGFIKIFTRIETYTGDGSFPGWIRRIFVTTALEHLRKNEPLKLSVSINEYTTEVEVVDASVLDQLSANDLMACITRLPNGFRTVFNLYAIEGYSHNEIAKMLNIKESTSRSQFIRAKKALQRDVQLLIGQENAKRNRL